MPVTETQFELPTHDGKTIYGRLMKPSGPTNMLAVYAHGLGLNHCNHLSHGFPRAMGAEGIAAAQFDFSPSVKNGRSLLDADFNLNVNRLDMGTFLRHLRRQFKKIVLVGHSLGGVAVQEADERLHEGLILIASACQEVMEVGNIFTDHGEHFVFKTGAPILVGKRMEASIRNLPPLSELAGRITKPLKVICGDGDRLRCYTEGYYNSARSVHKSMEIIPGAGHMFDNLGGDAALYKACARFIKSQKIRFAEDVVV